MVEGLFQPLLADETVILHTRLGRLRGFRQEILGKTVEAYLSVPFAEPPVGENRFRPPLIKKPWDDIRNASQLSPACYQVNFTRRVQILGESQGFKHNFSFKEFLKMV